jgi:hypothetical protein
LEGDAGIVLQPSAGIFKTSEEETLWSVIYNKKELSSTIFFDSKWDEPYFTHIL